MPVFPAVNQLQQALVVNGRIQQVIIGIDHRIGDVDPVRGQGQGIAELVFLVQVAQLLTVFQVGILVKKVCQAGQVFRSQKVGLVVDLRQAAIGCSDDEDLLVAAGLHHPVF